MGNCCEQSAITEYESVPSFTEQEKKRGATSRDPPKVSDADISNAATGKLGDDAADAMDNTAAAEKVNTCSKSGLVIQFESTDGSRKEVTFTERPLGMKYDSTSMPVEVADVTKNRHAAELGVQVGWKIISVNGEDVSSTPFNVVNAQITKLSKSLQLS